MIYQDKNSITGLYLTYIYIVLPDRLRRTIFTTLCEMRWKSWYKKYNITNYKKKCIYDVC